MAKEHWTTNSYCVLSTCKKINKTDQLNYIVLTTISFPPIKNINCNLIHIYIYIYRPMTDLNETRAPHHVLQYQVQALHQAILSPSSPIATVSLRSRSRDACHSAFSSA